MRVWASVVAIGGIVLFLASGQSVAEAMPTAAAFSVDTTEDSVDAAPGDGACEDAAGQCSLRGAVMETNALPGADTITVPAGTYELTLLENPEGHLVVTDDLTLTGEGASATIITQPEGIVDPNRIFEMPCGERVLQIEIIGVTISGGWGRAHGGGVDNCGNTVRLRKVAIVGNGATRGGGLFNDGGHVTVSESLFLGNGGELGAAATIAEDQDGGLNISLTNVTVSGNTTQGDSVSSWASSVIQGVVLTNVTVAGNTAHHFKRPFIVVGAYLKNSLVANNDGQDCWAYVSLGHNLSNDASCGADDLVAADADVAVGPLADNGGPTQTHALLPGSLAINGGTNDACPATDQRGVPRPQGGTCDIGAYELEIAATPTPAPTPTQAAAALPPTGGKTGGGEPGFALVALGLTLLGGVVAGYRLRRRNGAAR